MIALSMASLQEIEICVIRPMRLRFRAPAEVRGNAEAEEAALDIYRRALAPFPADVLRQAYQQAAQRHRYPSWPDCPDILAAAESLMPRPEPREWVEEAVALAHQYTERFMKTSSAAAKSREGGYEARLKRYVMEAAYLQGQFLAGREGGYSPDGILVAHLPPNERSEALNDAIARAAAQAARGCIQVRVPPEAVRMWKKEAESCMGR
jgi:hypothetical protein